MKDFFKNKKTIFAVVILIILLIIGVILSKFYSSRISVRKVLKNKYDSVKCIDLYCDGIIAESKDDKKVGVKIFDGNGNLVGKYDYKKTDKNVKEPFYLSNNYLLMKKEVKKDKIEYSINNKNAKEQYKTNNILSPINKYIILESAQAKIDYVYTILDAYGKEVISGVTDFESYVDGNILTGTKDTHNYIFNNKGKVLADGYKVNEEKDDYIILKATDKNLYYYFNISKSKIINEGFSSYIINDNYIEVVRNENNKDVVYNISNDGKETLAKESSSLTSFIKDVQKKIDKDKFSLYTGSIVETNATKVFVDNKSDNSFGIYDLKSKKYEKIYEYITNASYSEINKLESLDGKSYLQISCSEPMCPENKVYVYDYTNQKVLFNLNGTDKIASDYNQYKNNYKVIKYSRRSSNENYKNKYVLYDDKNNEVISSENPIVVVDSTLLFGKEYDKVLLYKTSTKKMLNTDKELATLEADKYYKYGKTLVDSKGKEIYKIASDSNLEYANEYVYAIGTNDVKVYSIDTNKVYTYKLEKNESILSLDNNKMIPFKSLILVNNGDKKHVKLINIKNNKARILKNINIFSMETDKDETKKYIITSEKKKGKIKYGLYILD